MNNLYRVYYHEDGIDTCCYVWSRNIDTAVRLAKDKAMPPNKDIHANLLFDSSSAEFTTYLLEDELGIGVFEAIIRP